MTLCQSAALLATGVVSFAATGQAYAEENESGALDRIRDRVTFSGTIEVDGGWHEDFAGEETSDLTLATATLGIEGKIAPWAMGTLSLDWDEEDDKVTVDEAFITLGKTDEIPVYLLAGRLYLPFGDFTSNMIQDPFTLTLGEIRATSVVGGGSFKGIEAALFAYKGLNEVGSADDIKGYGASAGYRFEGDGLAFSTGVAVVGNIADSGGIDDVLGEAGLDEVREYVPGFAAYGGATFGPVSIFAEYVAALDSFASEELAFVGEGARPAAINVEVAYTAELVGKETVFALGYQWSDEAVALGLPERRLLASAGVTLIEGLRIIGEYSHDWDYSLDDGGSDETANGVALRLAYAF